MADLEMMIFDGTKVEIIKDENGEPLFELYSTGMALGHIKWSDHHTKFYPRCDRIDNSIKNAEIEPFVHDGKKYLNESQLYDLMLEMKTDKIKPFRKWVVSEVLPSIRKHGVYATAEIAEKLLADPDFMIQTFTALKVERRRRQELEENIEINKVYTDFGKQITSYSNKSLPIGKFAKAVSDNTKINIGRNKLFEWLRSQDILCKDNTPRESYRKQGYFECIEQFKYGKIIVTPLITGKGQQWVYNKLLNSNLLLS